MDDGVIERPAPVPIFADLVAMLRQRAAATPERTAFVFLPDGEHEAGRLTYGAVEQGARPVAGWLRRQGAGGQPVLIACPTGPEFVLAIFGCLLAGAIATPVPAPGGRRAAARLAAVAAQTQAPVALTTGAALSAARLAESGAAASLRWQPVEAIGPAEAAGTALPAVDPAAPALLQYTSGSVGAPKGAVLSHANVLANLQQIGAACALDETVVGVFWLPLHHDMGLIGGLLAPFYLHGQAVLMPPAAFAERPARWLAAIGRYRGTISTAPNSAYDLCAERIPAAERSGLDLRSWQVALCGSEPVRAATLERFAAAFGPSGFRPTCWRPTYGLAEAGLMVTAPAAPPNAPFAAPHRLEAGAAPGAGAPARRLLAGCGQPVAGTRVCVVDPQRQVCVPPGEVGEIWVSGPSVAQGYWRDPAATAATFGARLADGDGPFLRTGDLGFWHGGQLFVSGRRKDLLIVNGENIHPEDVEAAVLDEHSAGVSEAAVFAVDTGEREEIVLLLERRREWRAGADAAQRQALAAAARRTAAAVGAAAAWVAVVRPAGLPRTTSGKVQRFRCRALWVERELPVEGEVVRFAAGATTATEAGAGCAAPGVEECRAAEALALHLLAEITGAPAGPELLDLPLAGLGLGSLQWVLLAARFQERSGRAIALGNAGVGATLRGLLDAACTETAG